MPVDCEQIQETLPIAFIRGSFNLWHNEFVIMLTCEPIYNNAVHRWRLPLHTWMSTCAVVYNTEANF